MPRELFFELGGNMPTITGYRAIIIVLTFCFLFLRRWPRNTLKIPFINLLILILLQKLFSLFYAFDLSKSLNGFFVFALETLLVYVILFKAINDREIIDGLVASIATAILIISIIGLIERYTQFNPIDYISSSNDPRFDPRNSNVVYSTFSHPIHFGTALAMGWPICLYILDKQTNPGKKSLLCICLLFVYAGLYFSQSRGPWVAFILAAVLLVLFKYPRIKVKIAPILILTALVLILRPGIYHSIYGLSQATFDAFSAEGSSFYYRLELYKKAYKEISRAPIRLAFGYGEGAAHLMDLRDRVSYGWGRERSFWSWDSQFASILLHGGFVGLILNLILYFSIIFHLIKRIKFVDEKDKGIIAVFISSISVLIFMMTNVAIFAPSLYFIMWTNVAIGTRMLSKDFRDESKFSETTLSRVRKV